MKASPECIPCAFRQALNTARLVSGSPEFHLRLLRRLAACPTCFDLDQTPAALSQPVYTIASEMTGGADPYKDQKDENNRAAISLLPELRRVLAESDDALDTALHAAVAGNIIDLGIGHAFDIGTDIIRLLKAPFAVNAIERFRAELEPGRKLLYLGDNAGEIVFDRLLVEQVLKAGVFVTFAVKSAPIINDATMEDAQTAGITGLVPVIETGSNDIGVNWRNVSGTFRKAFASADLIVAKGHGNFETCEDRPENVYFLLKAKCRIVADQLGVGLGDLVFKAART